MIDLDCNEPIELTDGSYDFVAQIGGVVRLRKTSDGTYIDLHIAELSQRMIGLPLDLTPSLGGLDALRSDIRDAAMSMSEHIEELLTGVHARRDAPRPEYDLASTSLNERKQSKVAELKALGIPASRSTLTRKIAAFREEGAAGLVDHRLVRQDGPLARLDPKVLDLLCEAIANQKNRSTGTISRVIGEVRATALKELGMDRSELPSDSSMYRYIEVLATGKHLTGSAKTRQSLGNRPDHTFRKRTETLPGGEMQVDSTTLDVLVRTPSGKVTRPILTILFDRATRAIVAHTFRLKATKGVDHAALLAQAFTPAQNRPDKSQFRESVQRANPGITLLGQEERAQLEANRPFIRPDTIMMDNGRDYVGNVFMAAAEQLKVNIRLSAPHTPTGKPLVERNFSSINTLFAQYLPGYVGRSADNRGYKVEEENLLDIYALFELFDDWVLNVWNSRPHKGLRDRIYSNIKLSPNQAYVAASQITGTVRTTLTTEQYITLLPSSFRKISSTGVQVGSRDYDSHELHRYRETRSSNKAKKGKWEVKVDPYNPLYAWVRSPENTWIECPVRDIDYDFYPHVGDELPDPEQQDRNLVVAVTAAIAGAPTLHSPPAADLDQTETDGDDEITHSEDSLPVFDPDKE